VAFIVDDTCLQTLFSGVSDVKSATAKLDKNLIFQSHTANLVVQTWMGTTLYVYRLETAPKVRDLRSQLKENSRTGIGTLFVVYEPMLPPPSKDIGLLDWQEALKSLTDGWIYSYNDQGQIQQVHFNQLPLADHYQCWHMTDFHVEHVSVRRREIANGLKGDWYLGDIASPAFKRRINYERVNQRFHYETRNAPKAARGVPTDELSAHYTLLGLERTATEREVKAAFRRLALNVHPDVSSLPRPEAERRIKELIRAYEAIKDHHGWV
jgi:hypothetical protein